MDRDSTTFLGNLCQCLITFREKGCFLTFRKNILYFGLCPFSLHLLSDITEKHPRFNFFALSFKDLRTFRRSPSQLFSTLNSLNSLSLSSRERCYSPSPFWSFTGLSVVTPYLSCTGEPKAGHSTPGMASPPLGKWMTSLLLLLALLLSSPGYH